MDGEMKFRGEDGKIKFRGGDGDKKKKNQGRRW